LIDFAQLLQFRAAWTTAGDANKASNIKTTSGDRFIEFPGVFQVEGSWRYTFM
jgi:hypothetical protein